MADVTSTSGGCRVRAQGSHLFLAECGAGVLLPPPPRPHAQHRGRGLAWAKPGEPGGPAEGQEPGRTCRRTWPTWHRPRPSSSLSRKPRMRLLPRDRARAVRPPHVSQGSGLPFLPKASLAKCHSCGSPSRCSHNRSKEAKRVGADLSPRTAVVKPQASSQCPPWSPHFSSKV